MEAIILAGPSGLGHVFQCERLHGCVPINPVLPDDFDSTDNSTRPDRDLAWWGVPFVVTQWDDAPEFVNYWKGNVRYDVRCLDGGAWDRSTVWGLFGTLKEALAMATLRKPSWEIITPGGAA